jgi:hypothetical protein
VRPYLEKNPSQKRAGVVGQGVHPEFKKQKENKRKHLMVSVFADGKAASKPTWARLMTLSSK